jgi:hypothetical protein
MIKKYLAQFMVWARIVISPTVVLAVYQATKDGVVTSKELGNIISQMEFKIKIPFVKRSRA